MENGELIYGLTKEGGNILYEVYNDEDLLFRKGNVTIDLFATSPIGVQQISADWNATSGVSQIANRPTDDQVIDWTVSQAGNNKIIHPDNYVGGGGSSTNNYVTAGVVSGNTLTLNRQGLSDVTIDVSTLVGGGGGSQTLNDTLALGNTTANNLDFTGDVVFDSKLNNQYSWRLRRNGGNNLEFIPSASNNGSDWTTARRITFSGGEGSITANNFIGNWNGLTQNVFHRYTSVVESNYTDTYGQGLSLGLTTGNSSFAINTTTHAVTTATGVEMVRLTSLGGRILSINPVGTTYFGKGYGEPNGGATILSNGSFYTNGVVYANSIIKAGGDGTNVLLDDGTVVAVSSLGGGGGSTEDFSAVGVSHIPMKTAANTYGNSGLVLTDGNARISTAKHLLLSNGSNYIEFAVRRTITSTSKTWSQKLVVGNPTGELQFSNVNETDAITNVFRVGGANNAFNITFGTGNTYDVLHAGNAGNYEVNYNKVQYFGTTVLTDSATISWDCINNQITKVTLAGNRTLTSSGFRNGAVYVLIVKQDSTGNRTLTYPSNYDFGDEGQPILSTGANSQDILNFYSDGNRMYFIGIKRGFSDVVV